MGEISHLESCRLLKVALFLFSLQALLVGMSFSDQLKDHFTTVSSRVRGYSHSTLNVNGNTLSPFNSASGSGDPDFLRPKAVENLTAKFDELLSQINVTWMDSSNADDANLTYFITYSVTARNETIFSTNNILSSTFFSYVIQGDFLQAGVIVDITVQACNDYGLGPLSVLPPIQAPGEFAPAPVNFITDDVSATSITLLWNDPFRVTPDAFILLYNVSKLSGLPANATEFNETLEYETVMSFSDDANYSYTIHGLFPYTSYRFELLAVYNEDQSSAATTCAQTLESAPGLVVNLEVTFLQELGAYSRAERTYSIPVRITWEPPTEPNGIISGYRYKLQETDNSSVVIPLMSTLDLTVSTNVTVNAFTNYSISLQAVTSGGEGMTEIEVILSPQAGPTPPQDVTAVALSSSKIEVMWLDPEYPNGVIIQYNVTLTDEDDGSMTYSTTDLFVVIEGLTPFTMYSVEVYGITVEPGDQGNTIVVTPEDEPSVVRRLNTTYNSSHLVVSWESPEMPNGNVSYNINITGQDLATNREFLNVSHVLSETMYVLIHNIEPYAQYTATVSAMTGAGEGNSTSDSFETPEGTPTAPTAFMINATNTTSLLSWQPPEDANGIITNYSVSLANQAQMVVIVLPSTDLEYEFMDLVPHTNYTAKVYATTSAGQGSTATQIFMTDIGIPSGPRNFTAFTGNATRTVFVSWEPPELPNGPEISYNIRVLLQETSAQQDNATTETMIRVSGLEPFTNYSIAVQACGGIGCSNFTDDIIIETLQEAPSEPTQVNATSVSSTEINVTWGPPEFPRGIITAYRVVYYPTTNSTNLGNSDVVVPETSLFVRNLTAFTEYTLLVSAITVAEGQAVVVTATTLEAAPSEPTQVNATSVSSTGINVTWGPPEFPQGIITVYRVVYHPTSNSTNLASFDVVFPETSLFVTNLTAFTNYTFRVSAITVEEGQAVVVTATTLEGAPSEPTQVNATSVSSTGINVTWGPPEFPQGIITVYRVVYHPTSNSTNFASFDVVVPETSLFVSNLTAFTNYTFRVSAITVEEGQAVVVTATTLEGAPSEPTQVNATSVSSTGINVTWGPPEFPRGIITVYRVVYHPTSNSTNLASFDVVVPETSLFVRNLTAFTEYTFRVSAITVEEGQAVVVTATTLEAAPSEPTQVNATSVSPTEINVTWGPPEFPRGIITGYRVVYHTTSNFTNLTSLDVVVPETSLFVRNLTAFTEYTFRVSAITVEEGQAVVVTATTLEAAPSEPTQVNATSVSPTEINVTWGPPEFPRGIITGYRVVYHPTSNFTYLTSLDVVVPETSLFVRNLTAFTEYTFRVSAITVEEGQAVVVTATTLEAAPSEPTQVNATSVSSTGINVTWGPPEFPRGIITGYHVVYHPTSNSTDLARLDVVIPETSLFVSDLTAFTEYTFRVSAITVEEGQAVVVTATTLEAAPSEPTQVNATSVSSTGINVTWGPPEFPRGIITGYRVVYYPTSNSTNFASLDVVFPETSLFVRNLTALTEYTFRVSAITVEEGQAVVVTATTLEAAPSEPTQVNATSVSSTGINVTWGPPEFPRGIITGYRVVYYPTSNSTNLASLDVVFPETSLFVRNLTAFTEYTFRVSAITVEEGQAVVVTATTLEAAPSEPTQVNATSVSSTGINVTWGPPEFPRGIITGYRVVYHPTTNSTILTNSDVVVPETSLFVRNLTTFTEYTFRVSAITVEEGQAVVVTATTLEAAPSEPTQVNATSVSSTGINVTWGPPEFPQGIIRAYRVVYYPTTNPSNLASFDVVFPETSLFVSNLTAFTNYTFQVSAITVEEGQAVVVTATTLEGAPSEPTQVNATSVSSTGINVTWGPPEFPRGIITVYRVVYHPTSNSTNLASFDVVVPETSLFVRNLTAFTEYTFRVSAITVEEGQAVVVRATTLEAAPSEPTQVNATSVSPTEINVTWGPPEFPRGIITVYRVVYHPTSNSTNFASLDVVVPETSLFVRNLTAFTEYIFRVSAITVEEGQAVVVTATTSEAAPSEPTQVNATSVSSTEISVTWGPPEIPRGIIRAYHVLYYPTTNSTAYLNNSITLIVDPPETSQSVINLTAYTDYTFLVFAVTIMEGPAVLVTATTFEAAPSKPTRVDAMSVNSAEILVTWGPPDTPRGIITAYRVEYYPSLNPNNSITQNIQPPDDNVLVSNLTAFTEYTFLVLAVTVEDGPAVQVSATTLEAAPSEPTQVNATSVSSTGITVTWGPPEFPRGIITGYRVVYYPTSNSTNLTNFDVVPETSLFVSNLTAFTEYTFRVSAITVVEGQAVVVNATTLEAAPSEPTDVNATSLSAVEINVTWGPPEFPRGIITGYRVVYYPTANSTNLITQLPDVVPQASSLAVYNLTAFTEYTFEVSAITVEEGPPALATASTPQAAPSRPTQVNATTVSSTEIRVTWGPPETPRGIITAYHVEYYPFLNPVDSLTRSLQPSDNSVLISDLAPFTEYILSVSAFTIEEGSAVQVSATTLEAAPSAPLNVTAVNTSSTSIRVNWEKPLVSNGIIRDYLVIYYRNLLGEANSTKEIVDGNTTVVELTDLDKYTEYTVFVRAQTVEVGNASDVVTTRTSEDVPSAPTNFAADELNSTSIFATWSVPEFPNGIILAYKLYYAKEVNAEFPNERSVAIDAKEGSNTYNATLTNLDAFMQYRLEVSASTSIGESVRTGPDFVTTDPDSASPPTNTVAITLNSTAIQLTWGYPIIPRGIIRGYTILHSEVGSEPEGLNITLPVPNDTDNLTFTFTDLLPFTMYGFRVAAYSFSDDGPFTIHFGEYSVIVVEQTNQAAPRSPPQNVMVSSSSSNSIVLSWQLPPVEGRNGIIIGYVVNYSNELHLTSGMVNSTVTSVTLDNLHEFEMYEIAVAAVTEAGVGPFSVAISVQTAEAAPSEPPQNVTASADSAVSLTVSWNEPPIEEQNGIISAYHVEYTNVIHTTIMNSTVNATEHQLILYNLHQHENYSIRVAAETGGGIGPFSNAVIVLTLQAVPSAAPVNVTVIPVSSTSIGVSWDPPPLEDQNGIITGFSLNYSSVRLLAEGTFQLNFTEGMLIVGGLEEFEEYNFTVAAETESGLGPSSVVLSAVTFEDVPSASPQGVGGQFINSTALNIAWQPPMPRDQNGIIRGYNISVNTSGDATDLFTEDTSIVLVDLEKFTYYSISVGATTVNGTGPLSFTVIQTDSDVPSAPLNVTYRNLSSTEIEVSWLPPADPNGIIDNYTLMYTLNDSMNISGILELSYNLTSLMPYLQYVIVVYALTDKGQGIGSDSLVVLTDEDFPSAPRMFEVTRVTESSMQLFASWSAPELRNGIITKFTVYCRKSEVQSYIEQQPAGLNNPFMEQSVTDGKASSVRFVTNLEPFTGYDCYVTATTSVGEGEQSNNDSARTDEDVPSDEPEEFIATVEGPSSIKLNWSRPSTPNGVITGYTLIFYNDSRVVIGEHQLDNVTLDYTVDDLNEDTEYTFMVNASTSVGTGPGATTVAQTDQDAPSAPPQGIVATPLTSTSIQVSWEDPPPLHQNGLIISYILNYTNENRSESVSMSLTDQNVTLTGLQEYEEYNFSVAAQTQPGIGPYSVAISVLTFQDIPSASPQGIGGQFINSTALNITWQPPMPGDQNGIIRGYNVSVNASGDATDLFTEDTSIVLVDLEKFTYYNVSVGARTVNGTGPLSFTVIQTDSDVPSAPLNLMYRNISATSIEVSWSLPAEPNGNIDSYILMYTEQAMNITIVITEIMELSYNLTQLLEYERYTIVIAAMTDKGPGPYSETLDVLTEEHFPDAPEQFTVTMVTSTTITATWEKPRDPNGIIQGYRLLITLQTPYLGLYNETFELGPDTFSYEFSDLHPFALYRIVLRAETSAGLGTETTYMPMTQEAAPTAGVMDLRTVVEGPTSIAVNWLPPSPGKWNGLLVNYTIRYVPISTCPGGDKVDELNGSSLALLSSDFVNSNDPQSISVENMQREASTITGLEEFQSYNISVTVATSIGENPEGDTPVECNMTDPDAPSDSPILLSFIILSDTEAEVTWDPPQLYNRNGIITNYTLRINNLNTSDEYIIDVPSEIFRAEDLIPFTIYTVEVAASTVVGIGPFSSPPLPNMTNEGFPEAPQEVIATIVNSTTLTLQWKAPAVPNGILAEYFITYQGFKDVNFEGFPTEEMDMTTEGTTLTLAELVPSTRYEITVSATTRAGRGPSSNTSEELPAAPPPVLSYDDYPELVPMAVENLDSGDDGINETSVTVGFSLPPVIGTNGPVDRVRIYVWRKESSNDSIDTYYESVRAPPLNSPQYAAIEIPINSNQNERKRQDSNNPIQVTVTIGDTSQECGKDQLVCNGPLDPGASYRVRYNLYSGNNFQEYPFSDNATFATDTAEDQTSVSASSDTGIIAGAIVAVLVVVIIIVLVFLVVGIFFQKRRSGKYVPRMNDKPLIPRDHHNNNILNSGPFLGPNDPGIVPMVETQDRVFTNRRTSTSTSTTNSRKVYIRDFTLHVHNMLTESGYKFSEEYERVTEIGMDHSKEASLMAENRAKNRYTNILAYDHSRVKLSFVDDEPGSDYVNACYIPGYRMRRAYIASQGPLPATFDDFWRMVWEQNTHTIVMLTQLVERGRTKCHRYWPGMEPSVYGDIAVEMISEKEKEDWTLREFRLNVEKKERYVRHFQFTSWPDHGVPDCPTAALDFVKTIRAQVEVQHGPIVVHCSAGVGRTGCFISLDTLLQHIKDYDWIDIFGLACEIRQHRNHMIQTEAQYVFIHKAMMEVMESMQTFKSSSYYSGYSSICFNQFADDSTQMSDYYGDYLSEETHM